MARLDDEGFELRCLDSYDYTTPLLISPSFLSTAFSVELNGLGGGSVTFSLDSELFTKRQISTPAYTQLVSGYYLLEREHLWQVYEGNQLRFEWLGETVTENLLNETETRTVTISGPGTASVLSWAKVLTVGFPTGNPNDFHRFSNMPSMQIWLELLQAAQGRGTITFVHPTFTTTADSASVEWEDKGPLVSTPTNNRADYTPVPGSNLLDLLTYLTGQDPTEPSPVMLDWYMRPGFQLEVKRRIGLNKDNSVVFHESGSMLSKERVRTREDLGNYAALYDVYGNSVWAHDDVSIATHRQREIFVQKDRPTSATLREDMAKTFLLQHNKERSTWTLKVAYGAKNRKVFEDYDLGDAVGVETSRYDIEPYRVMAISVAIDESGTPDLELTLESLFDLRQRELARRVTKLDNAVGPGSGNTIPYTAPAIEPELGDVLAYDTDTGTYTPTSVEDIIGDVETGIQVFIQDSDPGAAADEGDFWIEYP